jgi:hypothetical protein
MVDRKLTLLELNFGDGTVQIGPPTVGGPSGDDDATADGSDGEGDTVEDGGSRGRGLGLGLGLGKLLVVLGALVVLAVAVSKLRGDDDLDELEELADLDEE